ncbi:O-antigen translocase [Bacteroidia bacterium]|nr:O-antigen translocase [Bacteroidia bacterium]
MIPLRPYIASLRQSEFFKYSAALLSSNAIGQLIAIAVYPLLTRLYAPEIFGEFNWFLSLVGTLTLLTTGKYELAIVLPKSEKQATALFQLSLLITGGCFVLFGIITACWKENIAGVFHRESLVALLPFLPFYLLLGGIWQSLNYYFIRQKKYYNISTYNLSQNILSSGLKGLFGWKGFTQFGLIWGQFWGQCLATVGSVIAGRKSFKQLIYWDKEEIRMAAKTYSNFPKYELPHGLINSISGNLPVLLLSAYFGSREIGLFALAFMIGFRPINLLSSSIYQVLYKKIAEQIQQKKSFQSECRMFLKFCFFVFLPVFIGIFFIPDHWFEILFGNKWIDSRFYLRCLLPCLFLSLIVASLSCVPDVLFKQKTAMHIEIIYLIIKLIALYSGIYFNSFDLAILLYCGVATLMLSAKVIWYFRIIRTYELTNHTL